MKTLYAVCVLGALAISVVGCDGVAETTQNAAFIIRHSKTDTPVAGASLALAPVEGYKDQRTNFNGVIEYETVDEWIERQVKALNGSNVGMTNESGRASVTVEIFAVIGLLDRQLEDRLSEKEYYLRIRTPVVSDIVRVHMSKGTRVRGKTFIVEVADIGQPRPR